MSGIVSEITLFRNNARVKLDGISFKWGDEKLMKLLVCFFNQR
jgi:hypothetical protein